MLRRQIKILRIYFTNTRLHWPTLMKAALLAGAALRIAGLISSPIWYDESFTLAVSRLPLLDQVRMEFMDFNPPLWQLMASASMAIFGRNEFGLRLPSLLSSLVSLWLVWQILPRFYLFNNPGWLAGGLLVGLLPGLLWTAQDGRPYAVMSALYLAGWWFVWKFRWAGLGAVVGLLLYTHSTGPFYVAALALAAVVQYPGQWRRILAAAAIGGAAWLPWVPSVLAIVTGQTKSHWVGQLSANGFFTSLVQVFFVGAIPRWWQYAAVAVIVFSVGLAGILTVISGNRRQIALALWSTAPVLAMLAIAPVKNVIFYRPLSAAVIPVCIWLAGTLTPRRLRWWNWPLVAAWAALLIVGLVGWNPRIRGGELRDLAAVIGDQWQPGDVIFHATATSALPFAPYLQHDDQTYVLNEELPDGLLQTAIQNELGLQREALEAIPHRRAWVVYARDWLMTDQANRRMAGYIAGAQQIGAVHYWQASQIDVYLQGEP